MQDRGSDQSGKSSQFAKKSKYLKEIKNFRYCAILAYKCCKITENAKNSGFLVKTSYFQRVLRNLTTLLLALCTRAQMPVNGLAKGRNGVLRGARWGTNLACNRIGLPTSWLR